MNITIKFSDELLKIMENFNMDLLNIGIGVLGGIRRRSYVVLLSPL